MGDPCTKLLPDDGLIKKSRNI